MDFADAQALLRRATWMSLATGAICIAPAAGFLLAGLVDGNRPEIEFSCVLLVIFGAPGSAYVVLSRLLSRRSTSAARVLVGMGSLHATASVVGATLAWFMMNGDLVELAARLLIFAFLFAAGAAEATAFFARRAVAAAATLSNQARGFEPTIPGFDGSRAGKDTAAP